MHDFLVAEWKTLVAVVLFCGCIFGWFYADEVEKSKIDNAQYQMKCIRPGESVLGYKLGTPVSQLDLAGFTATNGGLENTTQYHSSDDGIVLTFRNDILVAAQIAIDHPDFSDSCKEDLKHFKKSTSTVAQAIPFEKSTDNIYEGLVVVTQTTPASDNEDEDTSKTATNKDASVIVVPI